MSQQKRVPVHSREASADPLHLPRLSPTAGGIWHDKQHTTVQNAHTWSALLAPHARNHHRSMPCARGRRLHAGAQNRTLSEKHVTSDSSQPTRVALLLLLLRATWHLSSLCCCVGGICVRRCLCAVCAVAVERGVACIAVGAHVGAVQTAGPQGTARSVVTTLPVPLFLRRAATYARHTLVSCSAPGPRRHNTVAHSGATHRTRQQGK